MYKTSSSQPLEDSLEGETFSPIKGDITLGADFAFSPTHNPRRCSTGVKEAPPEELRRLSDKGRQLIFDDPERFRTSAPQSTHTTSSVLSEGPGYQALSTIMEEETQGTFIISKQPQHHSLNLDPNAPPPKSLPPLNETHDLPCPTTTLPPEDPHALTKHPEQPQSPVHTQPQDPAASTSSPTYLQTSEGDETVTITTGTKTASPKSPSAADPNEKAKGGLIFIEISPGGCKRPPEGPTKDSLSKRSRITPTPAAAPSPVPQKALRPPPCPSRPSVLVTRKHSPPKSANSGAGAVRGRSRVAPHSLGSYIR